MFAREAIPANSFVAEYVGERMTNAEADRRGRESEGGDEYLYNIDAHLVQGTAGGPPVRRKPKVGEEVFVLDARTRGNVARFVNHSCDPNCVVFSVLFGQLEPQLARLAIFTARDVKAGEQLTYNCARPFCFSSSAARSSPRSLAKRSPLIGG